MEISINKDYPCASGYYTKGRTKDISYIVIHYTGGPGTALANVKYYAGAPVSKASAHYFVGHASENAQTYQSVEDADTAWHCGTTGTYHNDYCRNSNSIGIEMCCHNSGTDMSADSKTWYFDSQTVSATVELVKELMAKYVINADHVLRHYDVTGKICPAPFVNDANAWDEFKARLVEEEDDMATVITQIAQIAGLSQSDTITALGVLAKFANIKEDDWEKEGVEKLKEMGLINSDHDGRELVGFGAFGTMLARFKDSIK